MKIPTLVMESNALPGWTNRRLARFCTKAAVSFDHALPYFAGKGVVTGNPVRAEFFEIPEHDANSRADIDLLIFGGSQGAHAINEAMVAALPHLAAYKERLHITHQTGEKDLDDTRRGYQDALYTERTDVRPYIDDIVREFARADIIICRAGATTCAELVAAGRAAIMIPFPLAADDHQRKNAEALEQKGAARMILQSDLTGARLASEITRLLNAPEHIAEMERASRRERKGDAAAATVDLMGEMLNRES